MPRGAVPSSTNTAGGSVNILEKQLLTGVLKDCRDAVYIHSPEYVHQLMRFTTRKYIFKVTNGYLHYKRIFSHFLFFAHAIL